MDVLEIKKRRRWWLHIEEGSHAIEKWSWMKKGEVLRGKVRPWEEMWNLEKQWSLERLWEVCSVFFYYFLYFLFMIISLPSSFPSILFKFRFIFGWCGCISHTDCWFPFINDCWVWFLVDARDLCIFLVFFSIF